MRIIFAGTPHFAASALAALLANGHEIVAVLTQPDRPAGRGMQLAAGPVKQLAVQHGIPVLQPLSLKAAEIQQQLAIFQPDVMVVAAYGLILPTPVLQIPRYGCLNIHASLLPRWRGAAPIQRAILAGDMETGITIMQMDEGLDTGAMLLKLPCAISASDTSQTLHDKLAKLGAQAIIETLNNINMLHGAAQDATLATYAAKISKSEAQLDWTQSATQLERAIRAYNPVPGAYSSLNGTTIKIWQGSISEEGQGEPGAVLMINKYNIQVACGQGALNLEVLQRPNGKALPVSQFVQGFTVKAGDRFTAL
ncbi:MAG: methionyl-tRNA formyltransferase [Gallionellaceae bacterium]